MISTNDLRTGLTIDVDGEVYSVVEFQHVKPGKGAAFVRTKLKNMRTGRVVEQTFRAGEKVNRAHIERKEMQYLYREAESIVFMDNETYEQVSITEDQLGDNINYLQENMNIFVLIYNGIIPQALFAYYSFSGNRNALSIARDSLAFLSDTLFDQGYLNIVGNRGWWQRGQEIPRYDQQPVDACSMVLALKEAYLTTGEKKYLELARLAREWYSGKNINKTSLYNQETGGCYDALTPEGVNYNQGAEAILSLLYSFQAIEDLEEDPEEDGAESKIISGEVHIPQEKEQEGFANTPWGRWEVLLDAPDHKVKRITVDPGKRLSYQKHFKRQEHWYVVSGQALVTLDGEDIPLTSGQSVDIHQEAAHRVANPGETPLVFIETQTGSYFGEDDIVRLEDDYGRAD
jgi:translation elongation factor P/translation initiation factor 5A/mannose-6-phosphate isomerase-like protein (cupin superfamily)